jgi:hypothetical protein
MQSTRGQPSSPRKSDPVHCAPPVEAHNYFTTFTTSQKTAFSIHHLASLHDAAGIRPTFRSRVRSGSGKHNSIEDPSVCRLCWVPGAYSMYALYCKKGPSGMSEHRKHWHRKRPKARWAVSLLNRPGTPDGGACPCRLLSNP